MEEPRPRVTQFEIIDNTRYKSRTRTLLEGFLTLVFWTGFLYLLAPLVTIILWVFGVQIAYTELIGSEGFKELITLIKNGSIIIFIVTVIIVVWGYYNYLLFRIRGERRNSQVRISFDEDISARFHIDLERLQAAKRKTCLLVTLTKDGIDVNSKPKIASTDLIKGKIRKSSQ
jgi:poly-beta-1,6-N-acetyl-D-glucosamine biosynthesis protein PgaD